jgi:hypothetical protein
MRAQAYKHGIGHDKNGQSAAMSDPRTFADLELEKENLRRKIIRTQVSNEVQGDSEYLL